ncbi:VOC family protein [Fluviibacterium sp. DFM31]|uniref:VOC family protein n=1 Tax=Meridianimarinicoccus marinus TaxID=3231483 RepID=A0ABV3LBG4_9RHOB
MNKNTRKVAPIPRGYRSITPHICVSDVDAAVGLYVNAFGATVVSTETALGSETTLFAQLKIGNALVTIGQGEGFGPGIVSLHHYVENLDRTWESALAAGFTVVREPEETYWGDRMGLMLDPIGVRWSIGQRVTRLTAEEREIRAKTAMGYRAETAHAEPQPVGTPLSAQDLAENATVPPGAAPCPATERQPVDKTLSPFPTSMHDLNA